MPGKDGPPYAMIPSYITEFQSSPYLKHGEQRLGKVVKGAPSGLVEVELPPKQLHAEQGEDDDEEEEQEQQGSNGANRV
ncbi:hypothetical protein EYF80_024578 [Liparis tanakae]|uniref:Uncharacterized protein n=1 Tax=Liparis tanakae TaxID=230148 RepID=A0A4Z2HHU4_9TELE|nr:hypothetical protein EYF80_024578 [Liparis tanakae]